MSVHTNTVQNIELSLVLDGSEYQCQVIDTVLNLPGTAPGQSTEVGCPGGIVSEPGSTTDGSLTGNVFADPADGGITWALIQAYTTGAELTYEYVMWKDLGPTKAVRTNGRLKVNSIPLSFSKPGLAKHPLDLKLITAAVGRPGA